MNNWMAFAMGEANRGKEMMVGREKLLDIPDLHSTSKAGVFDLI